MWLMKDGPLSIQNDPNPTASALADSGSQTFQEFDNVLPRDIGWNRVCKYGFQGLGLFAIHKLGAIN
jgi:hypothetical protein